jgi:hypothetical protein
MYKILQEEVFLDNIFHQYKIRFLLDSEFQTSENYERFCLNKYNIFLNLAFGQVGEKN